MLRLQRSINRNPLLDLSRARSGRTAPGRKARATCRSSPSGTSCLTRRGQCRGLFVPNSPLIIASACVGCVVAKPMRNCYRYHRRRIRPKSAKPASDYVNVNAAHNSALRAKSRPQPLPGIGLALQHLLPTSWDRRPDQTFADLTARWWPAYASRTSSAARRRMSKRHSKSFSGSWQALAFCRPTTCDRCSR